MERRRSFTDLLGGAIFVLIGGVFVVASLSHELGTPLRMGPGYFPLVLGAILAALGAAIVVKGLIAGEMLEFGSIPWRAVLMTVAAVAFFGLTVRGLGFVPAVAVSGLLTALASRRTRMVTAVLIAAGLTVASVLIFVVGLQLRLPYFGPWLAL